MQDQGQREVTAGTVQPALKGIKVLDLTQFEGGPSCTEALAWLWCRRRQGGGTQPRRAGPLGHDRQSRRRSDLLRLLLPTRAASPNLKTEEGKEALLRRMIEKADVLMENMAPGTFARLASTGRDCTRSIRG